MGVRDYIRIALYGAFAGIAIGIGGLLNIVANTYLVPEIAAKIIGSLLFPIGLSLVCFLDLNLFTGKIGYLLDNDKSFLLKLLFIYIGNIIGSLIFGGWALVVFKGELHETVLVIASKKLFELSFRPIIKVFGGSVLCGALVYLAVFSYKTFKQVYLKLIGIFLAIGLFVFFGFDHCIANMFYFTFSWSWNNPVAYLNIAIVTFGNSIGAIALNEGIKAGKKLFKKNEEKSL